MQKTEADNAYVNVGDAGPYESPGNGPYEPPPGYEYESLSVTEVKPSSSPSRRVFWYAVGLSLAVAAVVGIVTGVTLHRLASAGK
jgi:hypothetical protein